MYKSLLEEYSHLSEPGNHNTMYTDMEEVMRILDNNQNIIDTFNDTHKNIIKNLSTMNDMKRYHKVTYNYR